MQCAQHNRIGGGSLSEVASLAQASPQRTYRRQHYRAGFAAVLLATGCMLLALSVQAADRLPQPGTGRIERLPPLGSGRFAARQIDVWLPDGYPNAGRYAVLYMQDGQMLFDASQTWNQQEWRVDEVAGALIAAGKTQPFIVVAIANAGKDRHSEYFPQAVLDRLDRSQRKVLYQAQRDSKTPLFSRRVYSDKYLRFLVEQVKPAIDRRYPVHRDPAHTFIMGSSMGGLISLYALVEYPEVFGGAACLSTHWPGTFDEDNNPVPQALLSYLGVRLPAAAKHRFYFDHGSETLDARYGPLQRRVDGLMRAKDYRYPLWQTRVFPGAEHSERAWSNRLNVPLEFLLAPSVPAPGPGP